MLPAHDPARPDRQFGSPAMTGKDEILAVLRTALPEMKRRWPIQSLAVFGSVARGEASLASDVDVLVEFARPIDLSEFLALEDALSALVGRRVDLVTRRALKPYIGRRVLDEAVPL
jgi:predicted nucleotidyltransferase